MAAHFLGYDQSMDHLQQQLTPISQAARTDGLEKVYEMSLSFAHDMGHLHVSIMRRVEGSCELHVRAHYGPSVDQEEFWRRSALNDIDEIKGLDRHIRPYHAVQFELKQQIDPVTTIAQARAAVMRYLDRLDDLPQHTECVSIYVGDARLHVWHSFPFQCKRSWEIVPVHTPRGGRPREQYPFVAEYSAGTYPDNNLVHYSTPVPIDYDYAVMERAALRMYAAVERGLVEADDMSEGIEFYQLTSKRFSDFDAARPQLTDEQKAKRRKQFAYSNLGRTASQGVDVEALLRADPAFSDDDVKNILMDSAVSGAEREVMVAKFAGAIEQAIEPRGDDEDQAPPHDD